ncbi:MULTISPECIES: heavy-metal-associated domain-containing protein [unclassified Coleofasciculus]|uniref:heavy-metal-associated domain-containing protein n=1 Tax=unclassified Coleofasciculus TaxID=2692782 RepID=UPI00187F0B1F|nr:MULTISPECIES: heavy-metal-associated domain-containing protein [unclassified Coleofasciculus]MBE9126123.1 heavy-metal-associated domain-containing protein [Coleofasciculus sp. LEGE 07081]MBE9147522.1 heavy-metal-associated domain-containing protein [Coleofasciculus sp. LEGE 07092]
MTLQLKVPKIACSACVNTVTKAVQSVDPAATVAADTKTKIVRIETNKSEAVIKDAIAKAGYPAA